MDAMTSHVASAPRTPTSQWRHRAPVATEAASLAQVRSILDKYGGNGSAYKGVPAALKHTPSIVKCGDTTTHQKVIPKIEQADTGLGAEYATTLSVPTPGAGALSAVRLLPRGGAGAARGVATAFGLGRCLGARLADGARVVDLAWGRAYLAPACVDESRVVALECQLRSLATLFGMLVDGLSMVPSIAESSDGQSAVFEVLQSEAMNRAPRSRWPHLRTLTAWLESSAMHPMAHHHDELSDVVVALGCLVRTRAELAGLRGVEGDPQLGGEQQLVTAVDAHLALLTQLRDETATKPGSIVETCRQWQGLLERTLRAVGMHEDHSVAADSGLSSVSRLRSWRRVRPGAKPIDERIEAGPTGVATTPRRSTQLPIPDTQAAQQAAIHYFASPIPVSRSHAPPVVHRQQSPSPTVHLSHAPPITCRWAAAPLQAQGGLAIAAATAALPPQGPAPPQQIPGHGPPIQRLTVCTSRPRLSVTAPPPQTMSSAPAAPVGTASSGGASAGGNPATVVHTPPQLPLFHGVRCFKHGVQLSGGGRGHHLLGMPGGYSWMAAPPRIRTAPLAGISSPSAATSAATTPVRLQRISLGTAVGGGQHPPAPAPLEVRLIRSESNSDSDDSLPAAPYVPLRPLLASGGLAVGGMVTLPDSR